MHFTLFYSIISNISEICISHTSHMPRNLEPKLANVQAYPFAFLAETFFKGMFIEIITTLSACRSQQVASTERKLPEQNCPNVLSELSKHIIITIITGKRHIYLQYLSHTEVQKLFIHLHFFLHEGWQELFSTFEPSKLQNHWKEFWK